MEKFGLTVRLNDILRLEGQLFLKAEHFEVTEIGLNGKLAKVTDQKTQLPPHNPTIIAKIFEFEFCQR